MRSTQTHLLKTLLALLLSLPTTALAQQAYDAPKESPSWTVQVDPLTTALGFVHVQVEYAFTDHFSLYAGPHLRLFNGLIAEPDDDYMGLGAEVGARWFFRGGAPRGWWAQGRGVLAHLSSGEETALGGYVSALGGYTWIFDSGFVLSAGLGVQYIRYQVAEQGPRGVLPAAHTTLGFAF